MNVNGTRNAPWWEAMVAFDVLAGGSLALVAGWAWLVCEVTGGACGCLLLLPAGALVAAAGVMLADGTDAARRAAVGFKLVAAALLAAGAVVAFSETGSPGWAGPGAALVLAEAGVLARAG
ncbi:MAG: hypothetical protein ACRC33_19580 [Gemmataceae bacterium]